jgi:hypothetical protein
MTDTTQTRATTLGDTGVVLPDREAIMALDVQPLIARYRLAIEHFDPRLFEIDHELLDQAYLPDAGVGRWSCRAVVSHLFDAELVYQHRLRRTLAEDCPVLENFDEQAFIDAPISGMTGRGEGADPIRVPVGAMAASIHTLRQTMAAALYQLPSADWQRRAMNPYLGETTFGDMLALATWHLEHHAAFINAKLIRTLGERPEPEVCEDMAGKPGGCGPGCGCAG